MNDYYVRYGNDVGVVGRTDYLPKKQAEKEYDKIKLDEAITWKEMWFEPIDEEEAQYFIKQDEVRVFDYGMFGKLVVPIRRTK